MQRIPQIDPAHAPKEVVETLDAVKASLGMVPNLYKTMAQSPVVLHGYLSLSDALDGGKLTPALREQIALATAGASGCNYCASAHSVLGKMAGLGADEIKHNLSGASGDAKAQAAITFARRLVIDRGVVSNADIAAVKAAGFNDEEVLEVFGNVVVNLFTNYFNHLAATDIDFPLVTTATAGH